MRTRLGFKAFDPHELLCHFAARRAGLYARHALAVDLLDTTFMTDHELAPDTVQVACGAALTAWLRGASWRVVFAAVDRPLFWLYAAPAIDRIEALAGTRIAGFPAIAPPAQFLHLVLERAGMDAAREVTIHAARDDTARLGLLRAGDVEAAVLSSAVAPALVQRAGFPALAFFGDAVRIPTTGLAVNEALHARRPELVAALVAAHAAALALIQGDAGLLGAVLEHDFGFDRAFIESTGSALRPGLTRDGRSVPDPAVIARLAQLHGLAAPPSPAALYDFSLLG